jgi:hypothetical protein
VLQERQWLVERYLQALHQVVEHLQEAGELEAAIRYAQRAVRADPLHEDAQRTLMRLYAAAGRPAAGLRQFRELERVLQQELAAAPNPDTTTLARELERLTAARSQPHPAAVEPSPATGEPAAVDRLEPVGGAVPVDSAFYVVRPPDLELRSAIARQDSIVLVKGARQMGKTSVLGRGLQHAREAGAMVVLTDLQTLNAAHLESADALLLTLGQWIGGQLGLEIMPDEVWNTRCAPTINFELYLRRQVLNRITAPIVWGLDGVDRLFPFDSGSELFALFRSWHDRRSLEPTGPLSRLTLAIAYATEAHLFITDLNQSPFNVGTRLTLDDFTLEQVGDLNRRYRSPLRNEAEVERLFALLHGQPYLVRRALHEMIARPIGLPALEAQADQDRGLFGDHLRGILSLLVQDSELCEVMRGVLQGRPCPSDESFYRLRSAGLLVGDSAREVQPRCQLYARYLERHLQ